MSESEFIIWKAESLEKVKREHMDFTRERALNYLKSIANEINESNPNFFAGYDYNAGLSA